VKRIEVYFIYTNEDNIMNLTNIEKQGRRDGKNGNVMEWVNLFNCTVHMYGITTV
jgi:hypothetical protein